MAQSSHRKRPQQKRLPDNVRCCNRQQRKPQTSCASGTAGGNATELAERARAQTHFIARAAKRLTDLRDAWLNRPEWTDRVPEVVPLGMSASPCPDRIVAKPGFEIELAKRTLTNLYNRRPAWLAQAHEALHATVAAAYGWADYTDAMPDDEILRRLLALNLARGGVALKAE